jgi:putative glutamine amidotransferase
MNEKKTLGYLPCYVGASIYPFDQLFDKSVCIRHPDDVKGCDAILLWGGEDIASWYYGEEPHPKNENQSGQPSIRDKREWGAMIRALFHDIPIIGVCRGAQFLCAFAGGKLIQHMTGHHGTHDVQWNDGTVYQTSSCHHQAMLPVGTEYELKAASEDGILEVVYFPLIKGYAIQGHPEWMEKDAPFVQRCFKDIAALLEPAHESA